MFISVPHDSITYLHIYILHTLSTYVMYLLLYNLLPFTCTSLIILHKTYLNIHCNAFVFTLSLIFTSQSHIILSIPSFIILFRNLIYKRTRTRKLTLCGFGLFALKTTFLKLLKTIIIHYHFCLPKIPHNL